MNINAVRCYAKLRAIGLCHSFSRAIAKHMPEGQAPALREVTPDSLSRVDAVLRAVITGKPVTEQAMTITDGYTVNRFYQS